MTHGTTGPAGERGPGRKGPEGPPLSPKQFAQKYGVGLTRVYEECRREDGLLHDVCVRWGRRILIPAAAAARIFEGEGGELDD